VNQFASSLVKQLVKGDAFLTHPSCNSLEVHDLLRSRQLHLMQPSLPKNTAVRVYGQTLMPERSKSSSGCSSSNRIQAAQSIRSRILSGINMTASTQGFNERVVTCESDQTPFSSSSSRSSNRSYSMSKGLGICSTTAKDNTCGSVTMPTPRQQDQGVGVVALTCDSHGALSSVVSSHSRQGSDSSTVNNRQTSLSMTSPAVPLVGFWDDLPAEVVSKVASHLEQSIGSLKPLYGTCRSWQSSILNDAQLLKGLQCSIDLRQPFPGSCIHIKTQLKQIRTFPKLLERAKAVGNVTAMACMARLLDAGGRTEEGLTLWRKCAKAGALEGQLRLGLALYRGTCGAVPDAEEAHMYLNRAKEAGPCGQERQGALWSRGHTGQRGPAIWGPCHGLPAF